MNKLFIIGNGFDRAHDLETRYEDFILWYINKKLKDLKSLTSTDEGILTLREDIDSPDTFKSLSEFIEYKNSRRIQYHPNHLLVQYIVDHYKEPNWSNIEYVYYKFLVQIYRALERNSDKFNFSVDSDIKSLNKCLDSIKNQLIIYLKTLGEPKVNSKIQDLIRKEIADTQRTYIGRVASITYQIQLLIFNYTSTINIYQDCIPEDVVTLNYIHGNIYDEHNPIVFGYGDETDDYYQKIENINSNEFLMNIKSFVYLQTGNYLKLSSFIDSGDFVVYILGHSCGISDRVLLKSIFEHRKCRKIKIFYHDKGDGSSDFFEKTQEISRHFSADLKDDMRRKIVPFDSCQSMNSLDRNSSHVS